MGKPTNAESELFPERMPSSFYNLVYRNRIHPKRNVHRELAGCLGIFAQFGCNSWRLPDAALKNQEQKQFENKVRQFYDAWDTP